MNNILLKQFEMTRSRLVKELEEIPTENFDVQPEGFNNTLHWHVGHVLTVAEQFLFAFPKKSNYLPNNYIELFGNGTKPADWNEDVPSVDNLKQQLEEQLVRIKELPEEHFNQQLPKPFLGCETIAELAGMALFHEANHLGQIHAMNRVIQK